MFMAQIFTVLIGLTDLRLLRYQNIKEKDESTHSKKIYGFIDMACVCVTTPKMLSPQIQLADLGGTVILEQLSWVDLFLQAPL